MLFGAARAARHSLEGVPDHVLEEEEGKVTNPRIAGVAGIRGAPLAERKLRDKHGRKARWEGTQKTEHHFVEMRFDVPQAHWLYLLDRSYSNLSLCYKIGMQTANDWLDAPIDPEDPEGPTNKDRLPDHGVGTASAKE